MRSENMSVYRVAGLPTNVSEHGAQSILDAFFGADAESKIRSLGLHPQRSSSVVATVAIVMFSKMPTCLNGASPWKLEEKVIEHDGQVRHVRLEVDTKFLGFTPLNTVSDNEEHQIDCVVVSGLSSHPFGSWKERGGQFMWLVDDNDAYPDNVRMLLYGYDTSLVASKSFQDITDIGERLALSVKSVRKPPRNKTRIEPRPRPRPIVFIAHSLGGLVVKEAVCHMIANDRFNAQCVYGLVFFGVPHQGLLVEPWLRMVNKQPNKGLVECLKHGSRVLQRLDDRFRDAFNFPGSKVISVYETLQSQTTKEKAPGVWDRSGEREVLVNTTSAVGHWPDCVSHTKIAVNRSHEDLPKFRGSFDEDYLLLTDCLQDLWSSAVSTVRKRVGTTEQDADAYDVYDEAGDSEPAIEPPLVGLLPLWPRPETEAAVNIETDLDLIAIHGLAGHALNTWTEGDKLWLRDFLPCGLPKVRVLTFGYDAGLVFTGSTSNTRDFALQLLEGIRQLRRRQNEKAERKTMFVCHDFGGLVFKQAMAVAHENKRLYGAIGESVAGVVFLGTPHRGAESKFWSDYLTKVARTHKLPHKSLPNLESKSSELGNVCSQFTERGMRLQIFSFYERLVTEPLDSLVVDEFSAILHIPNETPLPLDANHVGMCRYLTSSSANYLTVSNCITELVDTLSRDTGPTQFDLAERKFLSSLDAVDEMKVLDLTPVYLGKSSEWLRKNADFQSWTRPQGRQVIWLHGSPGSGKTVLLRSVVAHLVRQSEVSDGSLVRKPLHFFFDDKDLTRKTSVVFVKSILKQILSDSRTAFVIKYLEEQVNKEHAVNEDNLWMCLTKIIERSRGIIFQLVVDAVDEVLRNTSSASTTIIERLEKLTSLDSSGRVRIILSNREKRSYEFADANLAMIDVNNGTTQQNVQEYVCACVRKSLARSYISSSVAADIEDKIIEISRGNFLHARLAWEQFSRGVSQWSREQIQDSLSRLSKASEDFVAVYCRLLRSIPTSHRNQARASFAILRVSREKFTSHQLAFLATLYSRKLGGQPLLLHELKLQSADFESYLSRVCGYIIRKVDDGTVDFAHVSAKDLLTRSLEELEPDQRRIMERYIVSDPDAHAMLQTVCMSILEFEDRAPEAWLRALQNVTRARDELVKSFGTFLLDDQQQRQLVETGVSCLELIGKTPCFLYALRYWVTHYTLAAPSYSNDRMLASFSVTQTAYYCHMLWLAIRTRGQDGYLNTYDQVHTQPGTTVTAALFRTLARDDCPGIIKALIANGANVNSFQDIESFITPLSWAIICGRRESFQVLLRSEDISINYGQPLAPKAIHHAALRTADVYYIQTLAEHPYTNVNIMASVGTALHQAMREENVAAVQVLLNHQYISIDAKDKDGETPYSMVYRNKVWEPVMERMLHLGADKALSTTMGGTSPFILAGTLGWKRIEEVILRVDHKQVLMVDPDTKMNALATYAFFGRREKLLWILDRLPPATAKFGLRGEGEQYDVLHLCANHNWEDVVHRLQRQYHLVSLPRDHAGRTLLHWAMEYNWDTSRLDLGEYSSDALNAQDRDGLTAVHIAIANRNMPALELLVSSGASYMITDKNGMSPVHLAAEQGYRDALDFFIEMPEREFGRTNTGATLLHLLALWFDGGILSRFVRFKRAKLNLVDKQRRTALHYAAMVDNVSAAEQLVALGCNREARDVSGMTPLLEAIRGGGIDTAEQLLRLGADTRAIDAFGQSCLHLSFRYGHDGLVARCLAMKLNIDGVDRFGMTPLHRACSTGKVEHIDELLRRGAKWNPKNIHDRSPIDLAVECGNFDAVKAMLLWLDKERASERRRRRRLHTALKLACELELKSVDKILVQAGAQVDRSKIKVRRLYMLGPRPEPGRLRITYYNPPSYHNPWTPHHLRKWLK
ncbi:ankyrin repeat protein [Phialemonium atrogriseum]|uniref:Ankyrin repeat protein n=1 Tax=Phialemonium atrogriseum TaxID=1093897 RepID=A0AAJ0BPI8_9PEZI|nr:ankyrin repeat protein [Phialemonium atrogriseum]KAK1762095.1 ankyrin repeat protein [Phialemonium atrogriseum]